MADEADKKAGLIISPVHIAAWPAFWEAKAFEEPGGKKGTPMFQYIGLYEPDADLTEIKAKLKEVAVAQWGNTDGVKFPLKSGDAEADRILAKAARKAKSEGKDTKKTEADVKYYRGRLMLKAKSARAPEIIDAKGNTLHANIPAEAAKIWNGVQVRTEYNFKAYEFDDPDSDDGGVKKYVTAYFNFIMTLAKGERISGRDAKSVFKGLLGGTSAKDPTGDIPI